MRDLRVWQDRLQHISAHHSDSWTPPIDVYETEDRYVLAAELPGLSREHIQIAIEESRLTISGVRIDRTAAAADADAVHFHQVERGHGAFARTFEFGSRIATDDVSADLSDGVLTVTLPKAAPPPARSIEVR
jgi:HSP20 family protein